jgi:hypothetical protein
MEGARMKKHSLFTMILGFVVGVGVASIPSGETASPAEPDTSRFVEGSTIGIAADNPKQHNVLFVNTTDPATTERWPPNRWNVVDCSSIVPEDTKAVALSSLLIITHGKKSAIADLTVAVRRQGSTLDNSKNYHAQTIETDAAGGQRTPDTIWVALSSDLKFEVFWTKTDERSYPEGSAFGINMNLFGYLR